MKTILINKTANALIINDVFAYTLIDYIHIYIYREGNDLRFENQ